MTFLRPILAALACIALAACSPATTRALCDTSGVVLDAAQPASSAGKLAASVGRFMRGWLCPKNNTPGGGNRQGIETITPGAESPAGVLPLDGPDQRERLTAAP